MRIDYYPQYPSNPYTNLIYGEIARAGPEVRAWTPTARRRDVEVFHLHWIEAIAMGRFARRSALARAVATHRLIAALKRTRRRGGKVVWTVHNIAPHEDHAGQGPLGRSIAAILPYVDEVVSLSHSAAVLVAAKYPQFADRISVIPHPAYTTYPTGDRARARAALGIPADAKVAGMVSLIRPFKMINEVAEAFRSVEDPDAWLLVAGNCFEPRLVAQIEAAMTRLPRARLIVRHLEDQEYADLHAASDIIICAQRIVLNSGSVMAGLSLGRRVLARPTGSLPEVAEAVGPEWLILRDPIDGPAMIEALSTQAPQTGPDLSNFLLHTVADLHLRLYNR